MEESRINKRALSSDDARAVRQKGYDDAMEFALEIGLSSDYKNDAKAKKDVIDLSGDAHSVKGGEKKWQIFLYSLSRFSNDEFYRVMNGMGQLLINCIEAFPISFAEYEVKKAEAKNKLRPQMVALKEKLLDKDRLKAFMSKAMFNGGEVDYLTVKHKGVFYIFWGKEVTKLMSEKLEVTNSRAISEGQFPEQKVLFKYEGTNLGELEMRNDSPIHYREIRFNMVKPRVMHFLFSNIPQTGKFNDKVMIMGEAIKHFGKW